MPQDGQKMPGTPEQKRRVSLLVLGASIVVTYAVVEVWVA